MRLAVIPARGGSKRIPRKNIRDFHGKPIMAWSIAAARACALFDRIIVSTDDPEIGDIATRWGAEAPFLRPTELADDYTGTTAVVAHAGKWAATQAWQVDAICCIYATAPFIQPDDLERGLAALESGGWAYTFSATEFPAPIFRSFRIHPGGGVEMFFPEHFETRSQDLPTALHDAGQFYWGRPDAWLGGKAVFAPHSCPVLIPRWRVQDIDTPEDWHRAELIHAIIRAEP